MKTITYLYKKRPYTITVGAIARNTEIIVNGILCHYPKTVNVLKNIDKCIRYAINKYNAHKKLGLN